MTALDPAQRELQKYARARAGRIREGMRNYIATLGEIFAAWNDADWTVLGYTSWAEYVDAEFGAERVRLPADQRKKAVEELRLAGMSTRAIGTTLGVNRSTVQKDIQVGGIHPPDEVLGADGKRYRAPLAEAVEQAIVDATGRAEEAAAADRVDSAVASPGVPANTPGPAEAGATGAGPVPAPVADTTDPGVAAPAGSEPSSSEPGPFAAGGEREEASTRTPDGAASRVSPAPWTAEERKAHEEEVQVRKDIESAYAFAKTFVTAVRNQCFTILVGYRLGERDLVTAEQIADCRRALDLLEKEVIADAQR